MKPDLSTIPLHDIHLPAAVSWWPLAIGWWLLIILVMLTVAAWVWWLRRKRQHQWRVDALAVLRDIEQAHRQHSDAVQLVNELSVWLRRVCVSVFPRQQIAAVTGQRWLEALDTVFTNGRTAPPWRFDSQIGRVLIAVPYQQANADITIEVDSLLQLCRAWLKCLPQPSAEARMDAAPAGQRAGGGA